MTEPSCPTLFLGLPLGWTCPSSTVSNVALLQACPWIAARASWKQCQSSLVRCALSMQQCIVSQDSKGLPGETRWRTVSMFSGVGGLDLALSGLHPQSPNFH